MKLRDLFFIVLITTMLFALFMGSMVHLWFGNPFWETVLTVWLSTFVMLNIFCGIAIIFIKRS
jgi:hypothetical protein